MNTSNTKFTTSFWMYTNPSSVWVIWEGIRGSSQLESWRLGSRNTSTLSQPSTAPVSSLESDHFLVHFIHLSRLAFLSGFSTINSVLEAGKDLVDLVAGRVWWLRALQGHCHCLQELNRPVMIQFSEGGSAFAAWPETSPSNFGGFRSTH